MDRYYKAVLDKVCQCGHPIADHSIYGTCFECHHRCSYADLTCAVTHPPV